jgi:2-desacetyl-2-hydroxyethyl bacteriochlorophyllide A dehydrogenase
MRAAIFKEPFNLMMEDYPLSIPGKGELLVKVEVCGLCGTDFHIYKGESYSKPPVILGHEYVGIVSDKGPGVLDFELGDKVAIDPNIYCGECKYCRTGRINYCENLKALGVSINGGFAEYSIVPCSQAYILPKGFSLYSAAFSEPLSCCIRGMDQASIKHGEDLVILGGGTIGLLMLQLAKISGAGKIIVIEPIAEKRALASQLGADYVFDPNVDQLYEQITDLTSGGADVVIECVGKSAAADLAIKLARKGGRIVLFGLSEKNDTLNLNLQELFLKELNIKSSLLNPFTFSRALNILTSGKVDVEKLKPVLANLMSLEKILSHPRDLTVIKYQITPN